MIGDNLYGGSDRYFNRVAAKHGLKFDMVDTREPDNVVNALNANTKLVWFESMSNPLLRVSDIKTICELVHNYNKDIIVAVDNTFLTPYNSVSTTDGSVRNFH